MRWCALLLVACSADPAECPAGEFGCPCAAEGECNAGFVCADDGTCRDDEELETESSSTSTSTSTSATTTTTTITSTDESTDPDPTFTTTPTSGSTTDELPCVCGWSDQQELYTCGEALPPVGPPDLGMPECGDEGVLVGGPCDSVDPPITAYGCCWSEMFLAFCDPGTLTITLQECLVTQFGCVPAK